MAALLLIAGSYLLGALPFGLLIARWVAGIDIREHGSRNLGATNVVRVLGKKIGIAVFLCDVLKGLVPVWVATILQDEVGAAGWSPSLPLLCGVAAILGHVFPVYLRFRGGKGVATMFGVFLGMTWLATAIAGAVWLLIYKTTHVVALASLSMAVAFPVGVYALDPTAAVGDDLDVFIASLVLAVLVIVRHRSNISRLWKGEELAFDKKKERNV